jgi:hypothetical protein
MCSAVVACSFSVASSYPRQQQPFDRLREEVDRRPGSLGLAGGRACLLLASGRASNMASSHHAGAYLSTTPLILCCCNPSLLLMILRCWADAPTLKRRRDECVETPEKKQRISPRDTSFTSTQTPRQRMNYVGNGPTSRGPPGKRPRINSLDHGFSWAQVAPLSSGEAKMDPYHQMHIQSLPIIENLAIQILSTLAQGDQTLKIIRQPESELGQAYSTLRCVPTFSHVSGTC